MAFFTPLAKKHITNAINKAMGGGGHVRTFFGELAQKFEVEVICLVGVGVFVKATAPILRTCRERCFVAF
jgi:hypothetical protein